MTQSAASDWAPDDRLRLKPRTFGLRPFTRSFFLRPTEIVARELIGAWLVRRHENVLYGARIVETEAYLGSKDAAAHSFGGRRTPRVEAMYREGGHLYVFFVYGMHYCANVVTQREGVAEAVLLRAAEAPIDSRAGLLSGPARLCKALGITRELNGSDLLRSKQIRLLRGNAGVPRIAVTPRIGIDYAGSAKEWPLRFFDLDSPAVSGPTRLKKAK